MSPNYAVYKGLFSVCGKTGVLTVDEIDETEYGRVFPIIVIGESNEREVDVKALAGTVNQTIHIYVEKEQRGKLDEVTRAIIGEMRYGIPEKGGYVLTNPRVSTRLLKDKSTKQTLLHCVIDYTVDFSK